jgi:hypothetical protein
MSTPTPHVVACSACTFYDRIIHREVRRNEKLLRRGEPVDLAGIDKAKADKALCTSNGHHNDQAGPTARWASSS